MIALQDIQSLIYVHVDTLAFIEEAKALNNGWILIWLHLNLQSLKLNIVLLCKETRKSLFFSIDKIINIGTNFVIVEL